LVREQMVLGWLDVPSEYGYSLLGLLEGFVTYK
jgi:hypothetical protein